jgi:hypothetical protein
VVGDVDPRIGEHLLDVLAAGGIAAYLQPATDLHPVTRTTTLPARPTDRLYADREHLTTARDYLSQLTAVPEQSLPSSFTEADFESDAFTDDDFPTVEAASASAVDEDQAWASIVAGFHVTIDPTAVPWPEAEDVKTSGSAVADTETEPAPRNPIRRAADMIDQSSLLDGLDTFGAGLPDDGEDDDEGYTPPPAPPLPRISAASATALVALIGGLLLFFWPGLLPLGQSTTLLLAFSAVLGGFVALIWRLRPGDEDDDDPDNGARV